MNTTTNNLLALANVGAVAAVFAARHFRRTVERNVGEENLRLGCPRAVARAM